MPPNYNRVITVRVSALVESPETLPRGTRIRLRNDPRHSELETRPERELRLCGRGSARAPQAFFGGAQAGARHRKGRDRGGGEPDRARRSLEQRHPEVLFQLLDALAERGGAQRDSARSAAEIEATRGRIETRQTLDRRELQRDIVPNFDTQSN